MAKFRVLFSGTVEDSPAYRSLGDRMIAFVKDKEPGTEVYGWFLSADGRFTNEDGFADDESFLTHLGNVQEQGFLDEYMALTNIESVRVLGEPGEKALEALGPFSPTYLPMVGGF